MDPITRKEMFLAKAGGQSVKTPEPITREEMFLQRIAENGGGSGGGGGSANIDVTASVGQTIVVEEVDANGKPTKWKAADLPKQGHTVYITKEEIEAIEEDSSTIMSLANFDEFAPILYNGGNVWVAFDVEGAGNIYIHPDTWTFLEGFLMIVVDLSKTSLGFNDVNDPRWENTSILFVNGTWTPPTA